MMCHDPHRRQQRIGGRLAAGVFVVLALPGAALGLTQAELDMHRALWSAQNADDYTFHFQRSCFCPPDFIQPTWVDVRDGAVVNATDANTHEPLDPLNFPTIDELFAELQSAINLPAFLIEAQFDAGLGYPTEVYIDYEELLADDEISYAVRDVTVIPEPTGLVLAALCAAALTCSVRRFAIPAAVYRRIVPWRLAGAPDVVRTAGSWSGSRAVGPRAD